MPCRQMGGKNAAVVFCDADLTEAVPTLTRAAFINSGQVCLCPSRIFVHRDIYETFVELLVKEARWVGSGGRWEAARRWRLISGT